VKHFVARTAQLAGLVPVAHSRKAFLAALSDFERMLTVTLDYPRGCFSREDIEALRALADAVVEHIEARVNTHADRSAVEQQLVATIYRIRREVEAMYTTILAEPAGNPSRNADRSVVVSHSR